MPSDKHTITGAVTSVSPPDVHVDEYDQIDMYTVPTHAYNIKSRGTQCDNVIESIDLQTPVIHKVDTVLVDHTIQTDPTPQKQHKRKKTQTQRQPHGIKYVQTIKDTKTQDSQTKQHIVHDCSVLTDTCLTYDKSTTIDQISNKESTTRHVQTSQSMASTGTQYRTQKIEVSDEDTQSINITERELEQTSDVCETYEDSNCNNMEMEQLRQMLEQMNSCHALLETTRAEFRAMSHNT